MAAGDYRLCDVCRQKAFYDSNLNYDDGEGSIRNAGQMIEKTKLDRLGDWCVICIECAKTHKCVIVPLAQQATP